MFKIKYYSDKINVEIKAKPCYYIRKIIKISGVYYGKNVELYQLAPIPNVLMESYVIRTKNDKIIVIDGGYYDSEYSYYLHAAIRAILNLPENGYFEIEAWFLSHPHGDHFGEMGLQFEKYGKDSNFKVNNFYFDFADIDKHVYADGEDDRQYHEMFKSAFENYAKVNGISIKKSFYDDLNGAVINETAVKNGLTISIDGVDFEILQTRHESDVIVNGSSTVMKMKIYGDNGELVQSVMFLGDLSDQSGERLLRTVPKEKLKSDIVQMAHHGNWAVKKDVYDAIGASVKLWPTPSWCWNKVKPEFDIDKVREWVGTGMTSDKYNLVACLYKEYPKNRESVEDWKKVIGQMKLELPYDPEK